MGEFKITRWHCDCCGQVYDQRPRQGDVAVRLQYDVESTVQLTHEQMHALFTAPAPLDAPEPDPAFYGTRKLNELCASCTTALHQAITELQRKVDALRRKDLGEDHPWNNWRGFHLG